MTSPEPGWYADPSDSGQERWWGGAEWTHDVRPRAAAVVVAEVPGGGVNPFAALDAEEARIAAEAPASLTVDSSWYDSSRRAVAPPDSTNGFATAGFVLSLIPGLWLFGGILSAIGLVRASQLVRAGDFPVGRRLAAWGLGISVAAPLVIGVLSAAAIPVFLQQQELLTEQQVAEVAQEEQVAEAEVVLEKDGTPVVYDREEVEASLTYNFEKDGLEVEWITCPESAPMIVGGGFTCSFVFDGVTHTLGLTWTSSDADFETTVDGVVQK